MNPEGPAPRFENQTIVQTVRLSAGGVRLRLRISNEYGSTPLALGLVRVSLLSADADDIVGSEHVVTFSGRESADVPPGAPLISDPVYLPTKTLNKLRISIFLPTVVDTCSCHLLGGQHAFVSPRGRGAAFDQGHRDWISPTYRAFLSAVEVERLRAGPVIVAFGDSITDGFHATVDADKRWPDRLAGRLLADTRNPGAAVVNAGISGNRLLTDGKTPYQGQSALARFDRDVLSVPGATHVIVLEGINDIGAGGATPPSAANLIAGYRQLIARAHAHGISVIGGTILPYEGARYFHDEGEAVRLSVNAWIRTGREFDQVIDFDAAVRDPTHPSRLRPEWQSGDWLHPNDAGYQAMGDAIDLTLFRRGGFRRRRRHT